MDYKRLARQFAEQYGVDPDIFVRQIGAESGWNPKARSHAGALGIAQFMPATAKGMGVNPLDPVSSLRGAARYMANNLKQFGGDYRLALAAYNAGGGNARKALKSFPETIGYVNKILGDGQPVSQPAAQPVSTPGGGLDRRSRILQNVFADSPVMQMLINKRARQAAAEPPTEIPTDTSTQPATPGWGFEALFGLQRSSGDNDARGVHTANSYHYRKRKGGGVQAYDYGSAKNDPKKLMALAAYARKNPGLFAEFFYDPAGFQIKNGKIINRPLGGHGDHVHAAVY